MIFKNILSTSLPQCQAPRHFETYVVLYTNWLDWSVIFYFYSSCISVAAAAMARNTFCIIRIAYTQSSGNETKTQRYTETQTIIKSPTNFQVAW